MSVRRATHAGSWYTDDTETLDSELDGWLGLVQDGALEGFHPPIAGCKAVIAPHAGYSYSGPAAAWAYKSIDTTGIKRVFILGPSHHEYINGCALSKCLSYETPIGSLPLDLETISKLRESGRFSDMSLRVDEREHSIEMHLPYVRKIFAGLDIKIVPVLVGAINKTTEAEFGAVLAPYLAEPDTVCVVSSDFCHWGTRFSYTFYYPAPPPGSTPVRLSRSVKPNADHPIHKSITALDKQAMDILTLPSLAPDTKTAAQTHDAFASYLRETENSICGRHPIGVLLGALAEIEMGGKDATIKWVRYEQSSACTNISDSSVSYASAYVVF